MCRLSCILFAAVALLAVCCFVTTPAIACSGGQCSSGSCGVDHGGISGPMYNPNWQVGFRGARGGAGLGILARIRARLHPASSEASCGEASCGVEPSCGIESEPSCGCAAGEAPKSSQNDRPSDPVARHVGHPAIVTVRRLAPDLEPNPGSVAASRQ